MNKVISKILPIVFSANIALFLTLGSSVVLLGPKQTEKALTALFNTRNYINQYQKASPTIRMNENPKTLGERDEPSEAQRQIIDASTIPPLLVPTSGIAPRTAFLYTGPLSEGKHEGIDIWTNLNGTGMDGRTYGKGNPVYSSCNGSVRNVWEENGDVSIICDDLSEIYKEKLPSLKIKTLYGHMANQVTDDVYIYVKEGQRVNKGDLIGHQGNKCYWAPKNRVVHLHFGVYDVSVQPQIPLDPTNYIGVSCTTLNQEFIAGVE